MMFKNKKGYSTDYLFIIRLFFIFIIFLGFSVLIWDKINTEGFQQLDFVGNDTKEKIDDIGIALVVLDKYVPFIFLALWILVLYASITVVPEHPLFFIVNFTFLCLITLLSVVFADLGTLIFQNSEFTGTLSKISNVIFFAENYHYISFLIMIIGIALFFRNTKAGLERGIQ